MGKFKIKPVSNWLITLFLAVYFALALNLSVYKELAEIFSQLDEVSIGFIISIPIFFIAVFNLLFNVLSWPYFTKPFFILLIIISSMISYATYQYHVIFDRDMMANFFETNSKEMDPYMNPFVLGWICLFGVLPSLILALLPIKKEHTVWRLLVKKIASIVVSIVVILLVAALYYQNYVSVGRNHSVLKRLIVPTYFVNGLTGYLKENYFTKPMPYRYIGEDAQYNPAQFGAATQSAKPTLMVLVVGETARAQNYHYHGYPRDTNPYTAPLKPIYFQTVTSCGTATAVSVPCMFSNMTRENFNRKEADNQDNALDILKRAGIDILWKENDGGDKNVAKNVPIIELDNNKKDRLCNGESCLDEGLLEQLPQQINGMKGNRLVVLHIMGSHGPSYYLRYPQNMAYFKPDCLRSDIENCSQEELVNTFDNTIRYTDWVLADVIKTLKGLEKQYNTVMLYLSDHGESLGENGLYLHGMVYSLAPEYQTHVPMLLWMSPGYTKEQKLNEQCLRQRAKQDAYSQDFIFHSLLSAMNVATSAYDKQLDIFAPCRH